MVFLQFFRKACTCSSSWTSHSATLLETVYIHDRNADKERMRICHKMLNREVCCHPWQALESNGISNKDKTKGKVSNVWLQSHKVVQFWTQAQSPKSQVLRALSRWLPSTSNDGAITTLAFPYGPCTVLNAAASTLICLICTFIIEHWMFTGVHFFKETQESLTLKLTYLSRMSPFTWLLQFCLHPSWETTFCSHTPETLQW